VSAAEVEQLRRESAEAFVAWASAQEPDVMCRLWTEDDLTAFRAALAAKEKSK
jgi:hypothetical protein